jgi:hypothetical protein
MIEKQIGRFQLIPATDKNPPMILDTATGCLDLLVVGTNGHEVNRVAIPQPDRRIDNFCSILGVANVSSELVK